MSNMESYDQKIQEWIVVLEEYIGIFDDYEQKIEKVARGSSPSKYSEYSSMIQSAKKAIDRIKTESLDLFEVFYKLEEVKSHLDNSSQIVLSPSILKEALDLISSTSSEVDRIEKLKKRLTAVKQKCVNIGESYARQLSPTVQMDINIAAQLFDKYTSFTTSILFANIIRNSGKTLAAIGLAEKILDIEPETKERINSDVKERSGMHPLQSMGLTFNLVPTTEPATGSTIVDATLPQSIKAITYNIEPLISASAAAEFGSIACATSGLSYKLVQRLNTITESIVNKETMNPRIEDNLTPTVSWTENGGDNFQTMRFVPPINAPVISAGPKPVIYKLGEILEDAVLSADAGVLPDPEELKRKFQDDSAPVPYQLELLKKTLFKLFSRELEPLLANITPDTFRALILCDKRDLTLSYIARSIHIMLSKDIARDNARRDIIGIGSVAQLLGNVSAVNSIWKVQTETALTMFINVKNSEKGILKEMIDLYDIRSYDTKVYDAILREGETRKKELLSLFTKLIDETFAPKITKVVEKTSSITPPPSLKLYLLTKGTSS